MKTDRQPLTEDRGNSRAMQLLLKCWAAIQGLEGRHLDRKSFADYCGIGETAYSNWAVGATELNQIEALLRALERIPTACRHGLFAGLLREYPSLDAPAIAHDPVAVHWLRQLAKQARGIVIVQAERQYQGSYVLTALAHAATRLGSSTRKLAGFDFASGGAFVPVPGVTYADPLASSQVLRELVRESFPTQRPNNIILLNHVLSRLPELQEQILASHALHQFLICEGLDFRTEEIRDLTRQKPSPVVRVHVSELSGDRFGISISQN